jgi:hypothetical protein
MLTSASGWSTVASPNVEVDFDATHEADNQLLSVAGLSANKAWAVGSYGDLSGTSGTPRRSLALSWNGSAWRVDSAPHLGFMDELRGVAAVSPTNAWAVGYYAANVPLGKSFTLIDRWDGVHWQIDTSPSVGTQENSLNSVWAAPTAIWAVGYFRTGTQKEPLIVRGTGAPGSWTPVPITGFGELLGVSGTAANDVWAVGYGVGVPRILHFDGNTWTGVPTPSIEGGGKLNAVTAVSPKDAWTVGTAFNPKRTLVLHWDGTSWKTVPSP